jgi:hypothetical protein
MHALLIYLLIKLWFDIKLIYNSLIRRSSW